MPDNRNVNIAMVRLIESKQHKRRYISQMYFKLLLGYCRNNLVPTIKS